MDKPHSDLFGIPVNDIARICEVDLSTARRWKRGAICPPQTAVLLLRIIYHGDLAVLGPEWRGWRYRGGELTSPDGWRINRNDALAVPLMERQIKERDATIQALKHAQAEEFALEEQPLPEEALPLIVG